MIRIHATFATEAEAQAFRDAVYRAYHPDGYGTTIAIRQGEDGSWIAAGYRYASCD